MQPTEPAARTGRSAFAAAVFSALLPGAGQAYLRQWGRALAWAAPYVLLVAFVAGVMANERSSEGFLAQFAAPSWLMGTLAFIVIDLLYRLAAVVDAYRSATRVPTAKSSLQLRSASTAGLIGVVLVLLLSHVAVARPVYLAYDALSSIGGGDQTPIEPLPSEQPTGSPDTGPSQAPTRDPSVEPSATPDAAATPDATPVPSVSAAPTPVPGLPWDGTERLNILLIGSDAREGHVAALTDTMITVTIEPVTKQIGFINLPRDTTQVPLPIAWPAHAYHGGSYPGKINTLYSVARRDANLYPGTDAQRGYTALKGALSELYGLDIKYYMAVDLPGFTDVIETLDGVVIDVQVPVSDPHYPADDGRGSLKLYIPAGIQHMDGREALSFARARHETDDFDRSERQQRVITSVRQQTDLGELLAPGVLERLLSTFRTSVKTDIPPELFPRLVSLAQDVDVDQRVSLTLAPPTYSDQCYPCPGTGLFELRANVPAIRSAVAGLFTEAAAAAERRERLSAEAATVSLLNGTSNLNTKSTRIADALASLGVNASLPLANGGRADADTYTQTVITAYNGAGDDMPETVALLEEAFGVTVETADDPAQATDFVVIVGSETRVP
ncbi:MAG: LCP family protein [Chloroflexota bacterium]|nr:LCP family protein [Chloroflexota bacterium]